MDTTTTSQTCIATTKSGSQCRAAALPGSSWCWFHDPGKAAERAAARSKGGAARHGRHLDLTPGEPVTVRGVADVMHVLELAVNDALGLEPSIARARCLGYLCGVAYKGLELSTFEERLRVLEEAQHARGRLAGTAGACAPGFAGEP